MAMTVSTNMFGKRPDSHHVSTTIEGSVSWARSAPNDTSGVDSACITLRDSVRKVRGAPMPTHDGRRISHGLR